MKGDIFNFVAQKRPRSNVFDLSHDHKASLKMGFLYPMFVSECLPGDRFRITPSIMARFAPMIAPPMHRVKLKQEFFFVPNRLVWPNWGKFISGDDPFGVPPAFPRISSGLNVYSDDSLGAFLGLPTGDLGAMGEPISAIPFAAYQCIWSEYYRDENLDAPIDFKLADGTNNNTQLDNFRRRAWEHDYFTSALPWAQKGNPVEIPLDGAVPVVVDKDASDPYTNFLFSGSTSPSGPSNVGAPYADVGGINGTLYANLGNGNISITVNDLRRAEALQKWLEANARGGTRYTESIYMHFGVKSPDSRMQRPEFLGGMTTPMVISEVLQTSETSDTPQANMAGHGIAASGGNTIDYFCQEHGYILGLVSVMPDTAYQQGIPKHFFKLDKFDYGWPELANLGEQEILNKELYVAADGQNSMPFGYTPRYSEYKYLSNRVSGEFRSSLNFWHFGRIFASRPELNFSFVRGNPTTRPFAVELQDADQIYMHCFYNVSARRMLPRYGIPSIS